MAQSLRYGVSKAGRVERLVADELRLIAQEECESLAELDAWHRAEGEPLSSPFAVRENPVPAELRKFI